MKTKTLGYTDLELSIIGFGAWAIGGGGEWGWGPQDDRDSLAAIQEALDLGINWIDTAASYGHGRSEEVAGKAIKGRRDQVLIATKCGIVWDDEKNNFFRLKGWSIRKECEDSLRRLGVEVIDLYQVHINSPDEDIEESWTEVARLIEEGKVRYGGVSNWTVDQLRRVQEIHPVASLQPVYNMFDRGIEDEHLAYCASNDIGVIVYSPMVSGLLTGKFTKEMVAALPGDDFRATNNPHFQEPALSVTVEFVEQLRPLAERSNRSLPELAVAWALHRSEITAAIVGARRPGQIKQTTPAAAWDLNEEDLAEIEGLLSEREASLNAAGA